MIQSALLTALGFLLACLLFLFVAPAFWARAVRLTTRKLRNTLPISEAEVRASQDLIRAEYAVKVHQLSKSIEKSRLAAHRQTIELNRRDAIITQLQAEIARVTLDLAEHQNAHGVLKQTINDRLPKLEAGLEEARQLLEARDEAIQAMEEAAERHGVALDEARQLHQQQMSEIERLRQALAMAQAQDRRRTTEFGVDSDFALRSELDALRLANRNQSAMIQRLQAERAGPVVTLAAAAELPTELLQGDEDTLRQRISEQAAEILRLKRDLAEGMAPAAANIDGMALLQQIRSLEAKTRDQSDENRRLRDEIDQLQAALRPDDKVAVTESKAYLKTKLEKVEAQSRADREIINRLRAELASTNERAARQAAQFRDELRRLGTRTLTPVAGVPAGQPRSGRPSAPDSAAATHKLDRRSLWSARLLPRAAATGDVASNGSITEAAAPVAVAAAAPATDNTNLAAEPHPSTDTVDTAAIVGERDTAAPPSSASEEQEASTASDAQRRARLLDRLRTYEDAS